MIVVAGLHSAEESILTVQTPYSCEVKFESLLESLVYYTVIDNIKAKTFYNEQCKKYVLPFSRRDNYRDKF